MQSLYLELPRTIRLRFPAGFTSSIGGDFRTLLMHDGQNLFDENAIWGGWRLDDALGDAAFDDVVVLAIDNAADRMEAYTHVVDDIGTVNLLEDALTIISPCSTTKYCRGRATVSASSLKVNILL
ncbi:MAG: hypothetical protein GY822_17070 [Deltaproteobacteria bacterium]|nr:hypothetical protein [Deltaproteobacteria bacterium]